MSPAIPFPTPTLVIVVVLNWNGVVDTIGCLDSLAGLDYTPAQVIVVDNASDDHSIEQIAAQHPSVEIVESPTNVGFGRGMNLGIAWALEHGAEYVWLLNNDTVVAPSSLSAMVRIAERDHRVGIVGSVITDMEDVDRVQAFGGGTVDRWFGRTTTFGGPTTTPLQHVVGASMLLRRDFIRSVGGFDPRYFFFLEDTDLSLEATRRGWSIQVASDSFVRHRLGGTVNRGSRLRSLRADLLFARAVGTFIVRRCGPRMVIALPARLLAMVIARIIRGEARRIPAVTRAYVGGVLGGFGPPRPPSIDWILGARE